MENTTEDKELLLNQWQTCVDMANSVSQRRDNMNNIFITLNLAIMAAVSITWDIKSLFILIAGITICILWMLNIRNYKLLNTAKFNVINSCLLIKQLSVTSNSYICSGHARIGTDAKEHKVFASES